MIFVVSVSPRLAAAQRSFQLGQDAAAERELGSFSLDDPEAGIARLLLGALFLRQADLARSEAVLREARQTKNCPVEVLLLLGVVLKARGNFADALPQFEEAMQRGVRTADVFNHLGECWLGLDDAIRAGEAFRKAIDLEKANALFVFNLGLALKKGGRSYETFVTFRRVIDLDPKNEAAYLELWEQMGQLLNWSDGVGLLEQGYRYFPNSPRIKVALANTYTHLGQKVEANDLFASAFEDDPHSGIAYARWLQEEGLFDASQPVLLKTIERNPVQGQAYYHLAMSRCFEVAGRPLQEIITELLGQPSLAPEERMFLHYAKARIQDQAKDYAAAMAEYDEANRLAFEIYHRNTPTLFEDKEEEEDNRRRLYSGSRLADLQVHGSPDETPIFIVGMIRTGTTLLDQILSSHPEIESAGEHPFWQITAPRMNRKWLQEGVDGRDLAGVARDYLKALHETGGPGRRITDKMPINFAYLGLMSAAFPKARFIHTRRSPLDTCLSIYTTYLGPRTEFAYCKQSILSYYRYYLRAMEFWRTVMNKDQFLEIDYEQLVTDKERVLRGVIDFCGVDWNDALLTHEKNASQVTTPSLWTARQPVNSGSVERWRRYEPWLGELLELRDVEHPAPLRTVP